jgi:hypothetical protein
VKSAPASNFSLAIKGSTSPSTKLSQFHINNNNEQTKKKNNGKHDDADDGVVTVVVVVLASMSDKYRLMATFLRSGAPPLTLSLPRI